MGDVSLDEGVGGGTGAGIEGVVVGDVLHLDHPIGVEVRSILHVDKLAMAAYSLQRKHLLVKHSPLGIYHISKVLTL